MADRPDWSPDELDQLNGTTPTTAPVVGKRPDWSEDDLKQLNAAQPVQTQPEGQGPPTLAQIQPALKNRLDAHDVPGYYNPDEATLKQGPQRNVGDDVMRMVTSDIPFVDRAAAGIDTITGAGVPGASFSDSYNKNLQNERWKNQDVRFQHPYATPILGAAGAAAPMMVAGPEMGLADLTSPGLGVVGRSTLGGAAYGAAQGASNTPDLTNTSQAVKNTLEGAAIGGATGFVAPNLALPLAKTVAGAGNAVRSGVEGISNAAANDKAGMEGLLTTMHAAGPQNVQQTLDKLGPQGMLADVPGSLHAATHGVTVNSPEANTIISNTLNNRQQGTFNDLKDSLTKTVGPEVSPDNITSQIKTLRSQSHQALEPIFQNAPATPAQNELDFINQRLADAKGSEAAALGKIKNDILDTPAKAAVPPQRVQVNSPGTPTRWGMSPGSPAQPEVPISDAKQLDNVRQEVDQMLKPSYQNDTLGIAPGALNTQQGSLKMLRSMISQNLKTNVPGYEGVMNQSAALARKADAIEDGYTSLLQGGTTPTHPQDFSAQLAAADAAGQPEVREGYKIGASAALHRDFGVKRNDVAALQNDLQLDKGQSASGVQSYNQQKLNELFGQNNVNDLIGSMERNKTFKDTNTSIAAGFQTALKQGAAQRQAPANQDISKFPFLAYPEFSKIPELARRGVAALAAPRLSNPTSSYAERAGILTAQGPQRDAYVSALVDALNRKSQNTTAGKITANSIAPYLSVLGGNAFMPPRVSPGLIKTSQ